MIIINQDKDIIINFNNIIDIVINDLYDDKPGNLIIAVDILERRLILGSYKTEERAKEELKAITAMFVTSKMYESGTERVQENMCGKLLQGNLKPFVYEMPED